MRIVSQDEFKWMHDQRRLVRRYIAEHRHEQVGPCGISRYFARLRLELAAWKYANREMRRHGYSPHNLYFDR